MRVLLLKFPYEGFNVYRRINNFGKDVDMVSVGTTKLRSERQKKCWQNSWASPMQRNLIIRHGSQEEPGARTF